MAIPVSFSIEVEEKFGRWSFTVKLADRMVYWGHFNETVKTKGQAEEAAIGMFVYRLQNVLEEEW